MVGSPGAAIGSSADQDRATAQQRTLALLDEQTFIDQVRRSACRPLGRPLPTLADAGEVGVRQTGEGTLCSAVPVTASDLSGLLR